MQTPGLQILPVAPVQAAELTELARTTFLETYGGKTDPVNMCLYMDTHLTLESMRNELQTPGFSFFFAWKDDMPAGFIKIRRDRQPKGIEHRTCLQLERIYVLQQYQHAGIGSAFIDRIKDIAFRQGDQTIWLQVWQHNTSAIRFYTSKGFSIFETSSFQLGNETTMDYLMRFDLNN